MDTKNSKTTGKTVVPGQCGGQIRLSDKDIAHFRELLFQKRQEILGSVSEMQNQALFQSRLDAAGDLSRVPIHMADQGTDTNQQELTVGLLDSERELIREIDEALIRINDGEYGGCLASGKAIPKARLNAKPWAKYCVEHMRKIELGQSEEM